MPSVRGGEAHWTYRTYRSTGVAVRPYRAADGGTLQCLKFGRYLILAGLIGQDGFDLRACIPTTGKPQEEYEKQFYDDNGGAYLGVTVLPYDMEKHVCDGEQER